MNKFDFFNQWYDREDARRASLENSLNIPIGILTVVYAIQFYLTKEFDFESSTLGEMYLFVGFVGLSVASSFLTTYFLFKSYHDVVRGFKYKGLPYPTRLLEYEKELIAYYKLHKAYYNGVTGEEKFEQYLIMKLAELVDVNAYNNDFKSRYLHSSKRYIFISILTLIVAFIPFFINSIAKPERPQRIEIVNK